MHKPIICIGIVAYDGLDHQVSEDYMRLMYHLGRRHPEYDFQLAIKGKSEQFRARNAITKAADMQIVRNLSVEFGPDNIRFNCIAPGLVKTDFARALWDDPKLSAERAQATPLGRLGEPEDIAGAAVFLASRAGRWMTGQTIVIDGGVMIADA